MWVDRYGAEPIKGLAKEPDQILTREESRFFSVRGKFCLAREWLLLSPISNDLRTRMGRMAASLFSVQNKIENEAGLSGFRIVFMMRAVLQPETSGFLPLCKASGMPLQLAALWCCYRTMCAILHTRNHGYKRLHYPRSPMYSE